MDIKTIKDFFEYSFSDVTDYKYLTDKEKDLIPLKEFEDLQEGFIEIPVYVVIADISESDFELVGLADDILASKDIIMDHLIDEMGIEISPDLDDQIMALKPNKILNVNNGEVYYRLYKKHVYNP